MKTCAWKFIAALFVIAPNWKQLKRSSSEWINKLWYANSMESCAAIKWNELLIHSITDGSQNNWVKEARQKLVHTIWFHLYKRLEKENYVCINFLLLHHKLSSLKNTHLLSQFPCIRSSNMAYLDPLLSVSQGCNQGISVVWVSSEAWGPLPSSYDWWLNSFPCHVRLRSLLFDQSQLL